MMLGITLRVGSYRGAMATLAANPAAWPHGALTGLLLASARTPCISAIISWTLIRIGGLCTVTDVK